MLANDCGFPRASGRSGPAGQDLLHRRGQLGRSESTIRRLNDIREPAALIILGRRHADEYG